MLRFHKNFAGIVWESGNLEAWPLVPSVLLTTRWPWESQCTTLCPKTRRLAWNLKKLSSLIDSDLFSPEGLRTHREISAFWVSNCLWLIVQRSYATYLTNSIPFKTKPNIPFLFFACLQFQSKILVDTKNP